MSLTHYQKSIANSTLSAWAFYYLVLDTLHSNNSISTVRMGDGELELLKHCKSSNPENLVSWQTQEWRSRMGIEGIKCEELYNRIINAATECTHFAPNINGLVNEEFNLYEHFPYRTQYLDNFFVNIWQEKTKEELYKYAKSILFIHRNLHTADALQINCKNYMQIPVKFIILDNWKDTEYVIERAKQDPSKLVLFSGGPASKYISNRITFPGRVVLDIGNAIDYWTLSWLRK